MDFPVCPQCHQSVIDDDAVDCPFCGASMKGKPAAKPATKPLAKPTPPDTKTAGQTARPGITRPAPGGKVPPKASGKPGSTNDDFPFDIEVTSGKPAIQSLPSASKQRTLKVVCPMCDTAGYVPPTAVGQDVRCANPKCVMPVFNVPNPKKTETVVAPPPPPPPSKLPMIMGLLVVAIAVAGGGYWFMFLKPAGPKKLSEEAQEALREMQRANAPKDRAVGAPVADPKADNTAPVETKASNDQLVSQALKIMESTIYTGNKAVCRKLCAEAFAITGDDPSARKHLQALLDVGKSSLYYRIPPYVQLFWGEFAADKKTEAAASLAFAMKEVSKIPQHGRMRYEIAGQLAAALVAAGQTPEATKLLSEIRSENSKEPDPELAAKLQISLDGRAVPLSDDYTILPWQFPQHVAVTATLLNRGLADEAFAWASGQTVEDARTECLCYWAEDFAHRHLAEGTADADDKIANAIKSLPPELAARVWARAGQGRLLSKDNAGAAAAAKLAQEQLTKVGQPPQGPQMPDTRSMIRFKLPESTAPKFLRASIAAGEIALLQGQSAESATEAEKTLDLAMAFADATAPSFNAAAKAHAESESMGPLGRMKLATQFNSKMREEDKRTWALNYKDAIDRIYSASQTRFDLQTQILSQLVSVGKGLPQRIWIIVNSRDSTSDSNLKEDFFTTSLPGDLIEALKETPEEGAIKGAWMTHAKSSSPPRPVAVDFAEQLKINAAAAVRVVEQRLAKTPGRRDEVLVQTVSQLAASDNYKVAFAVARAIKDEFAKWESLRVAAAISAARGHGEQVLELLPGAAKQQGIETERAAICRGLITGLKAAGQ